MEMTGYEFVVRVLNKTGMDVGPLIDLAGGHEVDWLELKCASGPTNDVDEGCNLGDYQWHVGKALVAMANRTGGALVLGLTEKPVTPVSLERSDPKGYLQQGDWDGFLRTLKDKVIAPKKGWSGQKCGAWTIKQKYPIPLSQLFEIRRGTYDGKDILVVLVQCIKPDESPLILNSSKNRNSQVDLLIHRPNGDFGTTDTIEGEGAIADYWQRREIFTIGLESKLEKFFRDWEKRQKIAAYGKELEAAIEEYVSEETNSLGNIYDSPVPLLVREISELADKTNNADKTEKSRIVNRYNEEEEEEEEEEGSSQDESILLDDANLPERSDFLDKVDGRFRDDVINLLKNQSRILLLGESGTGKTFCLKHIQREWAKNYHPGEQVQIFISKLSGEFADLFSKISDLIGPLKAEDAREIARQGRLRVLIDGLSQCAAPLRQQIMLSLKSSIEDYPHLQIIVVAKPADIASVLFPEARVFELLPMNSEAQLIFLRRQLGEEAKVLSIWQELQDLPSGELIGGNPQLLELLGEVVSEKARFPESPAHLFEDFFSVWHSQKKLEMSRNICLDALSLLAFHSQLEAKNTFTADWAWQIISDSGLDISKSTRLNSVLKKAPFFEQVGPDTYTYSQSIFHDWLLARRLTWDGRMWEYLEESLANRSISFAVDWIMPLALAVCLDVEAIRKRSKVIGQISPWIAFLLNEGEDANLPKLTKRLRNLFDDALITIIRFIQTQISLWPQAKEKIKGKVTVATQAAYLTNHNILDKADLADWVKAFTTTDVRPSDLIQLFSSGLLERKDISAEMVNRIIKQCRRNAGQAAMLCRIGHFEPHEFPASLHKQWKTESSPRQAAMLIQSGIMKKEEFDARVSAWLLDETADNLARIKEAGLISATDLRDKMPELLTIQPERAAVLCNAGLLSPQTFVTRKVEWRATATPTQAIKLCQSHILNIDDFSIRQAEWAKKTSPMDFMKLAMSGILSWNDIEARKAEFQATATLKEAMGLCRTAFFEESDFLSRRKEWIQSSSPADALVMCKLGWATTDDLHCKRKEFIASSTQNEVIALAKANIVPPLEWLETTDLSQLLELVAAGVLDKGIASTRIRQLVNEAELATVIKLAKSKLLTTADIPEEKQIECLAQTSRLRKIKNYVRIKLVSLDVMRRYSVPEQFAEICHTTIPMDTWKNYAPDETVGVRDYAVNTLSPDELEAEQKKWVMKVVKKAPTDIKPGHLWHPQFTELIPYRIATQALNAPRNPRVGDWLEVTLHVSKSDGNLFAVPLKYRGSHEGVRNSV